MLRSVLILIIMMSTFGLVGLPVGASYYPPVCIPNQQVTFTKVGTSTSLLAYHPGLNTACAPADYTTPHLDHPAEVDWVYYWVEQQQRVGQTSTWVTTVIAGPFTWTADQLAQQMSSGPDYIIGGSVDITGATLSSHNRYRVVTQVSGSYSNSPTAPYYAVDEFIQTFWGNWVSGPDSVIVNGRVEDRPDEVVQQQREEQTSVHGLQSR